MNLFADLALLLSIIYILTVFVFFIGLLRPKRGTNKKQYSVSVVVAARNEEKNISNLLFDLTHQTWPKDSYEIIIANDGSSDKTAEIVQRYAKEFAHVKLVCIDKCPPGISPKKYALGKAVRQSSGEIILTTDADCRVGSRWIETMMSYFSDDVGFVVGFSQFGKKGQSMNTLEKFQALDFLQLMGAAAGTCNLGYPLAASGQNLAYRRKAFEQVGGYKKVAHRISGDDVLLLQLVRRHTNWKIVFASSASAFANSKPQSTFEDLMNQRKRWASNAAYQIILNPLFFVYLLLVFVYNFVLLVGVPLSFFTQVGFSAFLISLLGKASTELLFGLYASVFFKRRDMLTIFPLWFILQAPYVVVSGLGGTIGSFHWKDRRHAASMTDVLSNTYDVENEKSS